MQPLLARADGPRGALIAFTDEHAGGNVLDWSRLPAGSDRFTKPLALGGPPPSEDVALAANTAGQFVLAWRTAASTSRMTHSQRAEDCATTPQEDVASDPRPSQRLTPRVIAANARPAP